MKRSKKSAPIGIVLARKHGFKMYESGSVVGRIYWRVGNRFFPSRSWEDFPVPILSWWLAAYRKHVMHGTRQKFSFMDGPYLIRVSAGGRLTSELAFCRERVRSTDVHMKIRVSKRVLHRTLITAAEKLLSACGQMNVASDEIDTLHKELEKLRFR